MIENKNYTLLEVRWIWPKFIPVKALRLCAYRAKDSREKLILPTFTFMNTQHPAFGEDRMSGFGISLWWWDYCIFSFLVIF